MESVLRFQCQFSKIYFRKVVETADELDSSIRWMHSIFGDDAKYSVDDVDYDPGVKEVPVPRINDIVQMAACGHLYELHGWKEGTLLDAYMLDKICEGLMFNEEWAQQKCKDMGRWDSFVRAGEELLNTYIRYQGHDWQFIVKEPGVHYIDYLGPVVNPTRYADDLLKMLFDVSLGSASTVGNEDRHSIQKYLVSMIKDGVPINDWKMKDAILESVVYGDEHSFELESGMKPPESFTKISEIIEKYWSA